MDIVELNALTLGVHIFCSDLQSEVLSYFTSPFVVKRLEQQKLNGSFLLLKLDKVSRAGNNLIFNSGSSLFDKSLLQLKIEVCAGWKLTGWGMPFGRLVTEFLL